MEKKKISLKLNFDQLVTPCEKQSERSLEVVIQTEKNDDTYQRPPLNLALVIDRSGSMAGEKLEYVKQAASHVVTLLNDKDRVALVDYDNHVQVHFPSTLIDAESQPVLLKSIASIHSGNMTNLCDGWLTGCQQVAGWINPQTFNHSMLLTDGLANVGVTSPTEIASHAREIARRGVSTSTFGVGSDYDQNLLEEMANRGDGLFRFIEGPRDIPEIFKGVFKELLNIVAHEIEIKISYPPEVEVSLLGDWESECPEPGKLRIFLGSISAGKSREIYVKLTIPPGKPGTCLPIKASLMAKDEKGRMIELDSEGSITLVSKDDAENATRDAAMLERYAQVDIADKASAALKLEKEGKRQEASQLLNNILLTHQKHIDDETHMHFQSLSQRMAEGMDELDRKRSHSEAYMQKKYMSERQAFKLIPNAMGQLVFDYWGQLVLLDTGSQISFGKQKQWNFMGKQLVLPGDFMNISPEYLSQFIGVSIEFLLGMDVLKDLYFQINALKRVITFSEFHFRSAPITLRLETIKGVPYTEITINGEWHKVFVDTGAKINFLRRGALAGLEPVDTEMDFYPMIGEFETEVYQVPVTIHQETIIMRCGVLPPLLETPLTATGVDGILGTELYERYIASFERGTRKLFLEPYQE